MVAVDLSEPDGAGEARRAPLGRRGPHQLEQEPERGPVDPGPHWGVTGIHGVARPRRWDAVASAEGPGLAGDEVHFVALPNGDLVVDEDEPPLLPEIIQPSNYLMRMPDGTVKQMNPFTGTEVWTVPGRGHRPLGNHADAGQKIDPAKHDAHCAFCAERLLETPPEKARLVRAGDRWETLKNLPAERLFETVAESRRVPNLFEIVSWDSSVPSVDSR